MNRRSGMALIELLAAVVLLGLALVASTQLLLRGRALLDRMEWRARAVTAVSSELAWRDAGGEWRPGTHGWSSGAERALAGSRTTVTVAPDGGGLLRVTIVVEAEGRRLERVRLVARGGS